MKSQLEDSVALYLDSSMDSEGQTYLDSDKCLVVLGSVLQFFGSEMVQ